MISLKPTLFPGGVVQIWGRSRHPACRRAVPPRMGGGHYFISLMWDGMGGGVSFLSFAWQMAKKCHGNFCDERFMFVLINVSGHKRKSSKCWKLAKKNHWYDLGQTLTCGSAWFMWHREGGTSLSLYFGNGWNFPYHLRIWVSPWRCQDTLCSRKSFFTLHHAGVWN